MPDSTQSGRSARESAEQRARKERQRRLIKIAAVAAVFVGIAVATFVVFRNLANADLVAIREMNEELQSESQKYKHQVTEQSAQISRLQAQLASVQTTLNSIMPSANTYSIEPNQSRVVGNGKLTIALVGSPGNDGITLNINGKLQTVSAGQVLNLTPDPSTNCRVTVQSFDMFKTLLAATCAAAKPQ